MVDADEVLWRQVQFYLAQVSRRMEEMRTAHSQFDADESGEIDFSEFQAIMLHYTGGGYSSDQTMTLFNEMSSFEG